MKALANPAASIRARLLTLSKVEGVQFEYILLRYALERFLYRLGVSKYANQFILKGAAVFTIWLGPFCRVTRDADVEALGDATPDVLIGKFKEICQIPYPDDGITFDLTSFTHEEIKKEDKYPGLRIRFSATIGSARIALQFDIGIGDSVFPVAETMAYPTLLQHEAPHLKTYPRYTVVAEKFSTMLIRGMLNSRIKDYYDLWLLAETFPFDGAILQEAISRTFDRRNVTIPKTFPDALTNAFSALPSKASQWNAFIRTLGNAPTPQTFEDAIMQIQNFLSPITQETLFQGLQWDPTLKKWHPHPCTTCDKYMSHVKRPII
jgi:predicted nucleotidyltransferase component of viral defense system